MNRIITRIAPAPISRTCFFIALGLLLHAAPLAAEEGPFLDKPKASFEAKLGLIQKKYLEELPAGISNKYSKLLSDYAEASRAQGKLRDYLAAQKELERFQAAGKVEEQDVSADSEYVGKAQRSVIAAYESNLRNMRIEEAKLRQSYIQFLEKSKKALTRQNQIDQAILVDAEIEQVKASLDPSALAPATPARGAGENEPRAPASPASLVQKPIGEDRLVVFATDAKGPVSGLDITLKSQTFDKSFRKQTDRAGRAEFTILPELEYFIYILNSKYEPFIRPHCIGGESYVAEMQAMPEGVNVIEMPITGDFKLPGISNIRISGHYGLSGQKISGISLQPSSFRTSFSGNPPQQESIKLDLDTWMIVAERSRQVEIKALAPDDGIRLILYRELPPSDNGTAAQPGEGGIAANPPGAPNSIVQNPKDETRLIVLAKDPKAPIPGLEVVLTSHADGKTHSKRTDRTGKAEFTIDPEPEYAISIISKGYEPFIKPYCIGGETYTAELQAFSKGVEIIQMSGMGELKLPGISSIRIFGYTGNSGNISGIYMKPSSPKTTFSGATLGQDRIQLDVDQWVTVTEWSKSVEIRVLAPDAGTRIILYRKLP